MSPIDSSLIDACCTALLQGELVCFPTETVYALAANATDSAAVEKIFSVKKRPTTQPLSLLVSGLPMASTLGLFTAETEHLARHFWPGALTFIVPLRLPSSLSPDISAGNPTIGLRAPNHPIAQAILRQFPFPLVGTSVNYSGKQAAISRDTIEPGIAENVAVILDGGEAETGIASTVLDCTKTPFSIARQGLITEAEIHTILQTLL